MDFAAKPFDLMTECIWAAMNVLFFFIAESLPFQMLQSLILHYNVMTLMKNGLQDNIIKLLGM